MKLPPAFTYAPAAHFFALNRERPQEAESVGKYRQNVFLESEMVHAS